MGTGNANYFIKAQALPQPSGCILVELEGAAVPYLIGGLLTRLSPSVWLSDEDAAGAYQLLLAQMEAILSDCAAFLVNNIIAARGIDPAAPRDPATGVPALPPLGTTLADLYGALTFNERTAADYLSTIDQQTADTAEATQEGLLSEDGVLLQLLLAAI